MISEEKITFIFRYYAGMRALFIYSRFFTTPRLRFFARDAGLDYAFFIVYLLLRIAYLFHCNDYMAIVLAISFRYQV